MVVKTGTGYKACRQQAVPPASACLPPGLHAFSWLEKPALLSLFILGFPDSGGIKRYQRFWDSLYQGAKKYLTERSADSTLTVLPGALQRGAEVLISSLSGMNSFAHPQLSGHLISFILASNGGLI